MLTTHDLQAHATFYLRAAIVIPIACVLAFWIGALVSDREVEA